MINISFMTFLSKCHDEFVGKRKISNKLECHWEHKKLISAINL